MTAPAMMPFFAASLNPPEAAVAEELAGGGGGVVDVGVVDDVLDEEVDEGVASADAADLAAPAPAAAPLMKSLRGLAVWLASCPRAPTMLVRATAAERKLWRCIVMYIRRVQSERGAQ